MNELKKIGKVVRSKFVGTGSSFYKKRIYRAAVSQRLRNTGLGYGMDLSPSASFRSTFVPIQSVIQWILGSLPRGLRLWTYRDQVQDD